MPSSRFPMLAEERMRQRLEPPTGDRLRLVIDTDAHNEIDDQYTLAWALLSQDSFGIEAVLAAPYSFAHEREPLLTAYEELRHQRSSEGPEVAVVGSHRRWAQNLVEAGVDPGTLEFVGPAEGMELSYREILKVYELMDADPGGIVHRGSPGYLPSPDEPIHSDAATRLVELAMTGDERPLYVAAIGALTNVASAMLLEPRIIERIVVVWTSSYPSYAPHSNGPSLNLVQDVPASRLVFDSGVPHVYLPGFYIGAQLTISLPDMERWVQGRGRIGDYLHHLYTHNPIHHQRGITDQADRTWVIWDLITLAWLMQPEWVPTMLTRSPVLDQSLHWNHPDGRHLMREATGVDRDAIFRDFYRKLEHAP